jgi:hypothetical protein
VLIVSLVLVPISCSCWSFFGRWPRFSCHAQVSESNSVSSIRFLIKFSASVSSSRAGVGLRFLHQEPASDLRSPHQFGFAGDFFLFLLRFLQLVFSPSSSIRSAHVSEPKCVAEILSAQAVRPALFSRCRSSVSTASFLVSFRRGFARPTSILTSVHARVRSSCQGPVFSLSSAAGFSGSAPGHTSSHCSRFSVLSPAQDLGFGFAVLSFVSCSRVPLFDVSHF